MEEGKKQRKEEWKGKKAEGNMPETLEDMVEHKFRLLDLSCYLL